MSGANVKKIEVLSELRTALLRFQSESRESLTSMNSESTRTLEWLQSRQQYWQRELDRRRKVLEQTQRALNDCIRASKNNRSGGNCNEQIEAVNRAKQAVQEAEQELRNVEQFLKRVEEAYERFQREGYRLASILDGELVRGTSLLERSSATLARYTGSGGGDYSGGVGSGGAGGMNVPPYAETAVQYAANHQGQAQPGYIGNRPYTNDGREGTQVLPRITTDGNPISYREYDVHAYTSGVSRGAERILIGSDGRRWYTADHYRTVTQF